MSADNHIANKANRSTELEAAREIHRFSLGNGFTDQQSGDNTLDGTRSHLHTHVFNTSTKPSPVARPYTLNGTGANSYVNEEFDGDCRSEPTYDCSRRNHFNSYPMSAKRRKVSPSRGRYRSLNNNFLDISDTFNLPADLSGSYRRMQQGFKNFGNGSTPNLFGTSTPHRVNPPLFHQQEAEQGHSNDFLSLSRRSQIPQPNSSKDQSPIESKKEKKSITTKTFAHGMMDVSLLTSSATHLRTVLSDPDHEFYSLLLYLISASITLQIISGVLLIMADYFKTQIKERDIQTQGRRKMLNFIALALVMVVTSLNILISVFSSSGGRPASKSRDSEPKFASAGFKGDQSPHTEF